jgi:DNA-directed RNA polymerase subunit K/omega
MEEKFEFTKYERTRILGARGLQISMDAPLLLKINEDELIELNYDPLKIAEKELDAGVLPISIKRPNPEKGNEKEIEKIKIKDSLISDERKIKEEEEVEKEIVESGELSELTESEDDIMEKESLSASMEDSKDKSIKEEDY